MRYNETHTHNEQDEIRARRFLKVWEGRQAFAGLILSVLLIPAVLALAWFVKYPSRCAAAALVISLILLAVAGARLIVAASHAVELKNYLAELRRRAGLGVIDAEILSSWESQA